MSRLVDQMFQRWSRGRVVVSLPLPAEQVRSITVLTEGSTTKVQQFGSVPVLPDEPPIPCPVEYQDGKKLWWNKDKTEGYRYNDRTDSWVFVMEWR